MQDETFVLITQLASERFNLYRLAGKAHLTTEKQARLTTLTQRLAVLWDQHRRDVVSRHRARAPQIKPFSNFA